MKYLTIIILLTITACQSTSGYLKNDTYTSNSKAFRCKTPISKDSLRVTDDFDANGEVVRFDGYYGPHYRIERFVKNKHAISKLNKNLNLKSQLRQVHNNLMSAYTDKGYIISSQLIEEYSFQNNTQIYTVGINMEMNPTHKIRTYIYSISENFVNIITYSHTAHTKSDIRASIAKGKLFYSSIEFLQI